MKTMLPLGRDRDAVRNLCLLFVALLIAGLTPALYRSDESQPGELTVQVGKTVEISASNINFCWFPTVHRFPTGEILATMPEWG